MSGLWPGFESRARAVTVHFHDRGVGHGAFHIRLAADRIKAFLPDVPALTPSRKCLKTVLHLPNSSSQSRQGLPVRTIHSAASAKKRLFVPLDPALPGLPGSAGPSVPTACRSILIFSWRNCCTTGRFSTGPKRKRLVRHACGPGLSGYIKNRSELKGLKYRFALVSLRRYAMN